MITKEIPDREELLARAEAIGKLAESEAMEYDKNSRISDKLAQTIKDAQIPYLWRPKRFGGLNVDLQTYKDMIVKVANHSIAAAWLTYFYSVHEVWVGHLLPEGREEIFGKGGFVADVVAPLGRTEKDGDDYLLYGEWNFASGLPHSDWIGLGAIAELPDGNGPEYVLVALPVSECEIIENWDVMGIRGSGSNGVKVDGARVPLHRILPAARLLETGKPAGGDYDENDAMYRMPFMPLFTYGFPLMALGGAQRIVQEFQKRTEKRVRAFQAGAQAKDSPHMQRVLAELRMQQFSLEGLVDKYTAMLQKWHDENKTVISAEEKGLCFALRGHIAKTAAGMATKALLAFGGTSIFKGDPMEIFTRDLLALSSHANNLYEDSMVTYGATIFGMPGHPVW